MERNNLSLLNLIEEDYVDAQAREIWKNNTAVMLTMNFVMPKEVYRRDKVMSSEQIETYCQIRDKWTGNKVTKSRGGLKIDCLEYFSDVKKTEKGLLKKDEAEEFSDFQNESSEVVMLKYFSKKSKTDPGKVKTDEEWENSGLFSDKKVLTTEETKRIREELKKNEGPIWHGIISIRDEFTSRFNAQDDCIGFLHKYFPKLFRDNERDLDNIQVVGALHCNTDNRHIHFLCYEKEVDQKRNTIYEAGFTVDSLNQCREHASMFISGETETWKKKRTELVHEFKENTKDEKDSRLYCIVQELAGCLPRYGHLQYNREEIEPYKPTILKATMAIVGLYPEFKDKHDMIWHEYENKMTASPSPTHRKWYDKVLNDYESQLCNTVLGLVKVFNEQSCNNFDERLKSHKRWARIGSNDEPMNLYSKTKQNRKQNILFLAHRNLKVLFNTFVKDRFSRSVQQIEQEIAVNKRNMDYEMMEQKRQKYGAKR
ncbi:MAG: hypothetical protein EZS28_031852 [Streblomastix strix]|uniref:Uncharacterized protein n=1 Tax=Streblomastix strix TaxID=222440 RepID=A0A5J4URM7_9EUKA|nr:MAG: hypothetical protein EZS28_031852 [Streblomastix strix]